MLKLFKRHKIQEDKLAAVFVDHFLTAIDNGFPEVAALLNEAPEFVESPNVGYSDSDKFLLITLAANIMSVQRNFSSHNDHIVVRHILEKTAELCNVDYRALSNTITKNQAFISKVNHPSKNLVYGMSKAVFYKYELSKFQEDYFKHVNAPNPILLKRLDEAVVHFLYDWEEIATN